MLQLIVIVAMFLILSFKFGWKGFFGALVLFLLYCLFIGGGYYVKF